MTARLGPAAPFAFAPPLPPVAGAVGILGGTFDPIHLGHLAIAEEVREVLGLERILFVPAGRPPHKPGLPISPAADRLAMVELAVAGNSAFAVSRIEIDRPGPSYTVDTVARLLDGAGDAGPRPELTVIVSTELFGDLPTWHEPDRLLGLARLAVVPRPGHPTAGRAFLVDRFPGREDRVTFLDGPNLLLSATEIRARARAGRSIRYLVPEAVAAYIGDHALYHDRPGGQTDA